MTLRAAGTAPFVERIVDHHALAQHVAIVPEVVAPSEEAASRPAAWVRTAPNCLAKHNTFFAGTGRNSGSSSMTSVTSWGKARQSIVRGSRVIHFIYTSRSIR